MTLATLVPDRKALEQRIKSTAQRPTLDLKR
jgi:hypothetical protein